MANVRMTKMNIIVIFFLFSVPTACAIQSYKYTGVGCRGHRYHSEVRGKERYSENFWGGTFATEEAAARACDVIVYYIHPEHEYNFPDSHSYIEKFCESRDQAPAELKDLRKFIRSQAIRLVDAIVKETAEDHRTDGISERVGDGRPLPPDIGSSHHAPRPSFRQGEIDSLHLSPEPPPSQEVPSSLHLSPEPPLSQEVFSLLHPSPEPPFSQEVFSLLHLSPEPSFIREGNDLLHHAPEPSFSQDDRDEFLNEVLNVPADCDALLPNRPQLFNGEDQLQTAPSLEGVERWPCADWLLSRSDPVESIMVEMEKVILHFTVLSDVTCGEDISPQSSHPHISPP